MGSTARYGGEAHILDEQQLAARDGKLGRAYLRTPSILCQLVAVGREAVQVGVAKC